LVRGSLAGAALAEGAWIDAHEDLILRGAA
jgi:hypothetical protein